MREYSRIIEVNVNTTQIYEILKRLKIEFTILYTKDSYHS